MSEPTTCPSWEALLADALPDPAAREDLQRLLGSGLVAKPFDPAIFGFQPDGERNWIKRVIGENGRPGRVLAHLWVLPCDGRPTEYRLLLGSELDTYYHGSISSNGFAAMLLSAIAAPMDPDPEEEADLISVLLGNRSM